MFIICKYLTFNIDIFRLGLMIHQSPCLSISLSLTINMSIYLPNYLSTFFISTCEHGNNGAVSLIWGRGQDPLVRVAQALRLQTKVEVFRVGKYLQ